MTGATFRAYLEKCLVPTLKRDDVVIIDNLRAHCVAGVQELIEAAGATLRYLPQYSPDLDPIELVFAKVKALLRKAAARSLRALEHRIGATLTNGISAKTDQNGDSPIGPEFFQSDMGE